MSGIVVLKPESESISDIPMCQMENYDYGGLNGSVCPVGKTETDKKVLRKIVHNDLVMDILYSII